jgi:hypothetical protein
MGLHILPARSVSIFQEMAPDVIRLVVGTKPASPDLHSSLSPQEPPSISTDSDVASGAANIDTPSGQ